MLTKLKSRSANKLILVCSFILLLFIYFFFIEDEPEVGHIDLVMHESMTAFAEGVDINKMNFCQKAADVTCHKHEVTEYRACVLEKWQSSKEQCLGNLQVAVEWDGYFLGGRTYMLPVPAGDGNRNHVHHTRFTVMHLRNAKVNEQGFYIIIGNRGTGMWSPLSTAGLDSLFPRVRAKFPEGLWMTEPLDFPEPVPCDDTGFCMRFQYGLNDGCYDCKRLQVVTVDEPLWG